MVRISLSKITTMKKYKFNAIAKSFFKNEKGAYGITTGILSIPLFMTVAFTVDITGSLKDKSQLERVLDSASYTVTAENSKFRPKTFSRPADCDGSYQTLDYTQMSQKSKECQYYLILADIEKQTKQSNLARYENRNKLIIEATARLFLGAKDLIAPNDSERITKNITSDCSRESDPNQSSDSIVCLLSGSITRVNDFSITSRFESSGYKGSGTIQIGANAVATRADGTPPAMDIVLAVDISAPLIDDKSLRKYNYYGNNTSDALVVLYEQQKLNLGKVANFIGDLETKIFSSGMNPNNRISYLAFSGGGQEIPLDNRYHPIQGRFIADIDGTNRENVWPYVIAGGNGTSTPTPQQLTFRFHNNRYFSQLYFPFAKGQGAGSNFSVSSVCKSIPDTFYECGWSTQPLALQKPRDIHTNNSNTTLTSLNINDTDTILTQYLQKRFIQESETRYNVYGIGSQGSLDCNNQYTSGTGAGAGLQLGGQVLGINCYDLETNLNNDKVKIGVSSVFVGVSGLIDPELTVVGIANFNGQKQNYKLTRTADIPDTLMMTAGYPDKPKISGANTILDRYSYYLSQRINNGYKTDHYNFTPTRNVKDIDKDELDRQNSATFQSIDSSRYHYLNNRTILVSQWEDKNTYKNNQSQSNTLKDKFTFIAPSGVSFPSAGFLLGANRMMDINKTISSNRKTQRVLVVITHDRNERQDLLMMRDLVTAGMCEKIREKFTNNNKDFEGQIYIVNVSYIGSNKSNNNAIPFGFKYEYGNIRNDNFAKCVGNKNYHFIKSHYNTLDYDLNRLIGMIADENIQEVNNGRPITIQNKPML